MSKERTEKRSPPIDEHAGMRAAYLSLRAMESVRSGISLPVNIEGREMYVYQLLREAGISAWTPPGNRELPASGSPRFPPRRRSEIPDRLKN